MASKNKNKSVFLKKTSCSIFSQHPYREFAICPVLKKQLFSLKNVFLCYKTMDNVLRASIQFGMHLDSWEST